MIAIDQADILGFGSDLNDQRRALDLEILDHGYGITILQDIAVRVLNNPGGISTLFNGNHTPFVSTLRANKHLPVFVSIL